MDDPSTSGVEGFGLLDYNARFYDPITGRFTSADTIVPGGVQGLDRYAYSNNAPLNYIDPSGHEATPAEYSEPEECQLFSCTYNVNFEGMDSIHIVAVMLAVIKVGERLALNRGLGETNAEAFNAKFKGGVTFIWDLKCDGCRRGTKDNGNPCGSDYTSNGCVPSGGVTSWDGKTITFASMSGDRSWNFSLDRMMKNVIHELGHAFRHQTGDKELGNSFSRDALRPNTGGLDWQQHPPTMNDDGQDIPTELFADTFIAWVYDAWNTDSDPLIVDSVDTARNAMNDW